MLAAMSYNVWIFVSIVIGLGLGNWACGWRIAGNVDLKIKKDNVPASSTFARHIGEHR